MVIARITIPLPTTSIPTTRELRDILVIEPAKATLATLHAALTRLFLDNPRYHDARYVDTSHAAYLAVQVRRDTLALQALVASWMQYPPRIRVYEGNVRGVLWALDRKGPRGCLVVDFGLV
ncbi:hypothetical protein MMC26_000577 [Xylographa opegraphella]|nr:hypothetical protein [Xylographa opegraphella]